MKVEIHGTRRYWLAIIGAVFIVASSACEKPMDLPAPQYKTRIEKNVMVPMRDGVELAANIYFPVGLDQAPVIMVRLPYGKDKMAGMFGADIGKSVAGEGYIVVIQDVRGRYKSEGDFYPFATEAEDGADTIAWIRAQPWYGGKLGTFGGSYFGITQWAAAPGQDLDAMFLTVTSPNLYDVMYHGGELRLITAFFANVILFGDEHKVKMSHAAGKILRFDRLVSTLPLSRADERAGYDVNYFDALLDPVKMHNTYQYLDYDEKYREVCTPSLFVAGWYDMFLGPQLKDFNRLAEEGCGKANESKLIVGPWAHGGVANMGGDLFSGKSPVDYGPEAMSKELSFDYYLSWFDHHLKGLDNDVNSWPRVKIFVMGDNVWRDETEWPLSRTQYTNYYFHSGGNANTRAGDGVLSPEPPAGDEPPDRFTYDPLDPVPTKGGNNLFYNLGAQDQAGVEDRQDVLCYTTPPLEHDVEVTGPIKAVLYAATDAVDTDFTAKLVDVYPDGTAIIIQDGIVKAMYRNNDFANPTPLTPGAAEEYTIDMWATSNVFKAGHRIRIEVSSSNFPRYNRNLNKGEPVAAATEAVTARQTIYHDPEYPSHIILPVIPGREHTP